MNCFFTAEIAHVFFTNFFNKSVFSGKIREKKGKISLIKIINKNPSFFVSFFSSVGVGGRNLNIWKKVHKIYKEYRFRLRISLGTSFRMCMIDRHLLQKGMSIILSDSTFIEWSLGNDFKADGVGEVFLNSSYFCR